MTGQAFTLAGLLKGIDGARVRGDAGVSISDVRDDSRRVGPGDLFDSFRAPGDNVFAVKASFWLPIR